MKKLYPTSKQLFRYGLLGLTAAVLAACLGGGSYTQPDVGIAPPAGRPLPYGHTHRLPGSDAAYRVVSFQELPGWAAQPASGSLTAFRQSCTKLGARPEWAAVCRQAAATPSDPQAARQFFERYFTPWQVSQNGRSDGTFTGYYEPVLHGDSRQSARARFPIYGIPADFVSVSLPAHLKGSRATVRVNPAGNNSGVIHPQGQFTANLAHFPANERNSALKGRFEGGRFVPYFTRAQINGGALNGRAPILGYADDPVELFFLHIQGSGRIRTPDGRYIRLGFADKNNHPYVSIGKYMAQRGYLPLAQTSMQGIKAWLARNPRRLAEVLGQNPSYVFFRPLAGAPDEGPIGALGVPLTGGFSGAVDKQYITLGAPIYIATTHPDTRAGLNRLIVAQDTGSAIKGAVRVDYFWGYGDAAGQTAGKMKYPGYVWQLLPNGVLPTR